MLNQPVTRRHALGLIGLGAAFSAAPHAFQGQLPRGSVIRTLLRDYAPADLPAGALLFHEHLSMRYPLGVTEHFTDDVAMMIDEARAAKADGVGVIVDGGHTDMVRNIDALERIATESGLPVVASGGYYMQRTYPAEIASKSAAQIANELAEEARTQRFGAFGEIGQQGGVLTDDEHKVFEAVGKAQARTGLPLFTHNAYTGVRPTQNPVPKDTALKQLDILEGAGADLSHVCIGHMCCLNDPTAEVPIALAKRGVFVGFDRVTIQLVPDAQKVTTIMAMVEAGHADKVLLSSDFSSARALKKNGGPGLGQTVTVFGPLLVKAGMSEAMLRQILVDNARRFLAFVPKA